MGSFGENGSKRKAASAITVIGRRSINNDDPKCDKFLQNPVMRSTKSNFNSFGGSAEILDGTQKESDFIIQVLGMSPRSTFKSPIIRDQDLKKPTMYLYTGKVVPKVHKKEIKDTRNEPTKTINSIIETNARKEIEKTSKSKNKSTTLSTGEIVNKDLPSVFSNKPFTKKPFDYETKTNINNSTELENIVFYTKGSKPEHSFQNDSKKDSKLPKGVLNRNLASTNNSKERLHSSAKPKEEMERTHMSISPLLIAAAHTPDYKDNNDVDNLSDVINNSVTELVSSCLQKLADERLANSGKKAVLQLGESDERDLLRQPLKVSYNNYVDESKYGPFIAQRGMFKHGYKSASLDDAASSKAFSENDKFIRSTNRVIDISNAIKLKPKSATTENRISSIFDDLSLSQGLRKRTLKALNNPKQPFEAPNDAVEIIPKKKCTAVEPILSAAATTEHLNQNMKLPSIKNSLSSLSSEDNFKQGTKPLLSHDVQQHHPTIYSIVSTMSISSKINKRVSKETLTLHDERDEKEEEEGDDKRSIKLITEATNGPKTDANSFGFIDSVRGNQLENTKSNENIKHSQFFESEKISFFNVNSHENKTDSKKIEEREGSLHTGTNRELRHTGTIDKNSRDTENESREISCGSIYHDNIFEDKKNSNEAMAPVGKTLEHLKLDLMINENTSSKAALNIESNTHNNLPLKENFEVTQLDRGNRNEIQDIISRNEAELSLESRDNIKGSPDKELRDYVQEPQDQKSKDNIHESQVKESCDNVPEPQDKESCDNVLAPQDQESKDNIHESQVKYSCDDVPESQDKESSDNIREPHNKETRDDSQDSQDKETRGNIQTCQDKESNESRNITQVSQDQELEVMKDESCVKLKDVKDENVKENLKMKNHSEEFDLIVFKENLKNLSKLKDEFSSEFSEFEYDSDQTISLKEDATSLIDGISLNMPITLKSDIRNCDSQSSESYLDNDSHNEALDLEDKWDKYSINEEEELANALHKFIDLEGIDYDLYNRYLEFLEQRKNGYEDVCKNDRDSSRASILMSSNHGSTISLPCSLQFCSCCEEELRAKAQESRKDQCGSKLVLELSNEDFSHAENAPGSQSELEKEACVTAKSIQCDDPKNLLTVLASSEPQVTVVNSQLINYSSSLQDVRGEEISRTPKGVSEKVPKKFHIDYIREKKDLILHSQPLKNPPFEWENQELKSPEKKRDKVKKKKELIELANRESIRTKIPIRVGSDMLARFGQSKNNVYPVNNSYSYPANYAAQIKTNQRLPPIGWTDNRKQTLRPQPPVNANTKNMVFDFLNPFKRKHNTRGKWSRGPISVKPSPIKPQKGYEYEDLNNKRKLAPEKRRNSGGKIYIQDPNDKYNILVAEEIGYVYGDIRKNIAPIKQPKVERGMQTAEVKEAVAVKNGVLKNNQSNQKSIINKKKPNLPPTKKGTKSEPVVTFVMDLHAASKLETPREKGDYVIYPSRNLPKLKSKNVSFKEAERGIKSISSTIPENTKERLYANRRDVAIDLPPPHFYDPRHRNYYKPAPVVGPPKGFGYSNGGIATSRVVPPKPKPVLERRASFDGKLPPVIGRSRKDVPGQFFNQIQHASSQPNLSQNTHNSFLPPQIAPNRDSPLRTFDDPLPQAASAPIPGRGMKKGWGLAKQLTMKSKDDTTIDMPYGSTTDLLRDMPGRRSKGPSVPIVLLQGFFKGGPKPNQNYGKPTDKQKVSIPKTLLEPNSLLRGALPVLPTYLAAICLIFNIFVPGLGTLLSGWFGYCAGRTRLGPDEKSSHRLTSVIITAVTGFVQLFTVTFFLVGWFWSISWGIILVSVARRYKKFMAEHRASMAKKVGLNMLTVNAA